jgi:hypothetical protein
MAMLPPWAAYLAALTGWLDGDWIDPETLRLGMNVEYVSCVLFPILCLLALDVRPPRMARVALCATFAVAVSAFVQRGLGWEGVTLFWTSGVVTYAGWLFAIPSEARVRTLMSRMLLTVGCLIPIVFIVIVVARITGAESVLLLGFLYFFTLQVLEVSGTFIRFERRLSTIAVARA